MKIKSKRIAKFKHIGKIFLGPFITSVIVLLILIISIIFAAISQTNGNVQRSVENHMADDMREASEAYAKSVCFAMNNGIADLNLILSSDTFTYKIIFVTDYAGNILAKSDLAKYTIHENNIFDHFSGGEYLKDTSEQQIRDLLTHEEFGTFGVRKNQTDYLIFRPLGINGYRLFYMLHQADIERTYSEGAEYLKSAKSLGGAYVTVLVGLVILMGSYIFYVAKTIDTKLGISKQKVRYAQEQARTYSNITRVLSQAYVKIYYIDLSNGHYKLFASPQSEQEAPIQYEGKDFWNVICDEIVRDTIEKDKKMVTAFFNRQSLLDVIAKEGSSNCRFQMKVNGVDTYFYMKACPTESNGQQYLIIGIKNVDATVVHDMNQLAETEAALRRVEIYRGALLDNMLAYLELNITKGRIVEGPFITNGEKNGRLLGSSDFAMPETIDELAESWGRYLYSAGAEQDEYIRSNSCAHLRQEFEKGRSIVEINFDAQWNDGTVRGIRQNYYMSRREKDGDIVALCVLYDMTEKKARDREIANLTEELNQSRIKISTSQMQPHFLYNVLGSIREIILEDPQYASDLICDFTTHLRACIKSLSNDDLVPFSKEVDNIHAYVNIERMRFGDRMQVEFDIQHDNFDVVPLSIQPLVENAIRHGLYPKKDGMGIVKISSFSQNGFSVIVIKDNGVGFDYEKVTREIAEHKRDSTGLLNLTLRLEKVLNAKVYFDSKPGLGTTVTILIPEKKEGIAE